MAAPVLQGGFPAPVVQADPMPDEGMVDGERPGNGPHGLMLVQAGSDDLELKRQGIGAMVRWVHGLSPLSIVDDLGNFSWVHFSGGRSRVVGSYRNGWWRRSGFRSTEQRGPDRPEPPLFPVILRGPFTSCHRSPDAKRSPLCIPATPLVRVRRLPPRPFPSSDEGERDDASPIGCRDGGATLEGVDASEFGTAYDKASGAPSPKHHVSDAHRDTKSPREAVERHHPLCERHVP